MRLALLNYGGNVENYQEEDKELNGMDIQQFLDSQDVLSCGLSQRRYVTSLNEEQFIELIKFVTSEPDQDSNLKSQYKYPFIACEFLVDYSQFLQPKFEASPKPFQELFKILLQEQQINTVISGYFSQIISRYIKDMTITICDFFFQNEIYIQGLINHLDQISIAQVAQDFIFLLNVDCQFLQKNYIEERGFVIQKLIQIIMTKQGEMHAKNASNILVAFLQTIFLNYSENYIPFHQEILEKFLITYENISFFIKDQEVFSNFSELLILMLKMHDSLKVQIIEEIMTSF